MNKAILLVFIIGFLGCCKGVKGRSDMELLDAQLDTLTNDEISPTIKISTSRRINDLLSINLEADKVTMQLLRQTVLYDPPSAYNLLERIVSSTTSDSELHYLALFEIGKINYKKGHTILAFRQFYDASTNLSRFNNDIDLANVYVEIANLYLEIGDYIESEKILNKAIFLGNKHNDIQIILKCYQLLSLTYLKTDDGTQALQFAQRAQSIVNNHYKELSKQQIKNSYELVGDVDMTLDSGKIALEYYNLALKHCENVQDYYQLMLKIATFKAEKSSNKEFLTIKDLIDGLIVTNSHISTAGFDLVLSKYYQNIGDNTLAIIKAERAYNSAKKINNSRDQVSALQTLIQLQINTGKNASEIVRLTDSLQVAKRNLRNRCARIIYDIDEIERAKEIAHENLKRTIGKSIMIILITIFTLIIARQYLSRRRINQIKVQIKNNKNVYREIVNYKKILESIRSGEEQRISNELSTSINDRLRQAKDNLLSLTNSNDINIQQQRQTQFRQLQVIEREIRDISHGLNNEIFTGGSSFNLILQRLIRRFEREDLKLLSQIENTINWDLVGSAVKMNLYIILENFLRNMSKYSFSNNIFITIAHYESNIQLILIEDGRGYSQKWNHGLSNTKNAIKRANSLHGSVDIQTRVGKGTTIIVNLPLSHQIPTYGHEDQYYYC